MKKLLLILFVNLSLTGCVSFDVVKSKTVATGDASKKQGAGQVIETRGGLWGGVVLNLGVPLPPLVLKHGEETTTVWKQNGEVVYTEQVDTEANGASCLILMLRCGESRKIGSWGDFLFNNTGGYH
jgi:uncharacterized protein YceK